MRLPDSLLDDCLCDPSAPLARDPARDYGLDRPQAQIQLAGLKEWLREQQSMLMATRQDAVLLVLQGPDCAGKNGVVRRVLAGLDPLGMSAIGFQAPTPDERREGFLQRYRERLPAPGTLGVFNRSYYEALVSDVRDGLCAVADLPQRYGAIAEFEQRMHAQRIHPLKCYLQLSLGEQKRRLHRRLDHPEKRWKLTLGDLRDHRHFADHQAQWAEVLGRTHRDAAPWYVIPADHRWLRDLIVASLLAREFERLALSWPSRPAPFSHADLDGTP